MTFRSALRQSVYDLLRHPSSGTRSWSGDQYIDFDPCTVNFAARVNGALTADTPFAAITFDTVTTGAYTDIVVDQVIIVSPTNDARDPLALRLRARKTPTSVSLPINEISYAIADNSYIFGLLTFDATDKLARPLSTTAQVKDYDQTYAALPPTVSGLQTGYAGMVGASGKFRLVLSITASNGELGSTISSYAWTFAAGTYTVISGGLTSAAVMVDLDPGWQWAMLIVTDSNGQVCRRHFAIAAHDDTIYPVSTIAFNGAQISGTVDQGWSATFDAFDGVQDILNGAFCIIWTDNYYNGFHTPLTGPQLAIVTNKALTSNVATLTTSSAHYFEVGDVVCVDSIGAPFDGPHVIASVPTSTTFTFAVTNANIASVAASGTAIVYRNSVDMVGWLDGETSSTENDAQAGIIPSVQFRVSGVAARIAEVEAQMLAVRDAATPDEWDEILQLTPWRSIIHYLHRHTTVLNLCDWFDDDHGSTNRFPYVTPQGTNILDTVRGIASAIKSTIEFGPTGEIQLVRDARFRADRFSITALGNFAYADFYDINEYSLGHWDKVGKANVAGAFYNALSGQSEAFRAVAPGYAQGSGAGSASAVNLILDFGGSASTAKLQLRQIAGDILSVENKSWKLSIKQPDGYGFGVPSLADPYTWVLDTTYNARNLSLTTANKWLLESISITHDNEQGTRDIDWNYTGVTPIGDKGDNIPPIKEGEIPSFELPPLSPLPDYPAPEIGWTPDEVPSPDALKPPVGTVAALDGSTMLYWDDAGAGLWTTGTAVKLRSPIWRDITPDLASGYAIKCAMWDIFYSKIANPAYALAYDPTNSRVYYTANGAAGDIVFAEGTAYTGVYTLIRPTSTRGAVMIYGPAVDPGSGTINISYTKGTGAASVTSGGTVTITSGIQAGVDNVQFDVSPCAIMRYVSNTGWSLYGSPGDSAWNQIDCAAVSHNQFNPASITALPDAEIQTFGINSATPFAITLRLIANSGAAVRLSTDNGATFGSPVTIGTSPGGVGGFDVQYIGSVSYAAMAGKIRIATTLGGAYSDHAAFVGANPRAIVIPWSRQNSTTANNLAVSDPDCIVALDQIDSGGGTLYWLDAAGTKTDITPVAGITFNSANCIRTWLGTNITVVGQVSSVTKCYDSQDGGATWTLRGTVASATYIRGKRKRAKDGDMLAPHQLFVAGGSTLDYSATDGVNLETRTKPSSSGGGIDVLN